MTIGRALQEGGIEAAYACYAELRNSDSQKYELNGYDLISLAYQLMGAGKLDQAIEVLQLNIRAFPGEIESYTLAASLHAKKGERGQAEGVLREALAVEPNNTEVAERLARIRVGERDGKT